MDDGVNPSSRNPCPDLHASEKTRADSTPSAFERLVVMREFKISPYSVQYSVLSRPFCKLNQPKRSRLPSPIDLAVAAAAAEPCFIK